MSTASSAISQHMVSQRTHTKPNPVKSKQKKQSFKQSCSRLHKPTVSKERKHTSHLMKFLGLCILAVSVGVLLVALNSQWLAEWGSSPPDTSNAHITDSTNKLVTHLLSLSLSFFPFFFSALTWTFDREPDDLDDDFGLVPWIDNLSAGLAETSVHWMAPFVSGGGYCSEALSFVYELGKLYD
jgi:hypothetical protein